MRDAPTPTSTSAQKPSREVDALTQAKSELVRAREVSRHASAARSEFISNMSHELRTPMNAVIGMAEALWETDLNDEQRRLLSVLMSGGKSMLSIINDVLDFSQIEAGKLKLEKSEFKLEAPLKTVLQLLTPVAEAKKLAIRVEGDDCLQERVCGDYGKLEQILMNLVGNAVKFTQSGSITIRVRRTGPSKSHVQFAIADTGIGICKEKLDAVFNRFTQCDMSLTKAYGGSGLGLAISKQLVEIMDGEIFVQSVEGEGSTFVFSVALPLAERGHVTASKQTQKEIDPKQIEEELAGLKILVVEDSQDNAFLISTFLKNIDCELDFARNGRDAIEKFEQATYDLILMDVQMPEMDGYSATKWIRVLETKKAHRTPIVALTAYAFTEQLQKSLEAGCDAHLSKPIDKRSLLNAIAAFTIS